MKNVRQPLRSLVALIGLAAGGVFFVFFAFHQRGGLPLPEMLRVEIEDDRPLVIVDAGHGGVDGGAQASGFLEKDLSLDMANRVELELKTLGMRVIQTRKGDETLSLEQRTRIANAHPEAVFVSIHFNTSSYAEVGGLEIYHTSPKSLSAVAGIKRLHGIPADIRLEDDRNRLLAEAVQAAVVGEVDCKDRGVRNRSLRVTRETVCPSVLVECAYLTNTAQAEQLRDGAYRVLLAQGIARGVRDYLDAAERSGDRRFGLVLEETVGDEGAAEIVATQSTKDASKGQSGESSSERTQPRRSPGTATYDHAAR